MNKVKKIIENVMVILCVAFAIWFLFSFVEVDMKIVKFEPRYMQKDLL